MPAPAASDMIDWPEAFGTRFTVTVDTEEEFDWRAPLDSANRSVATTFALRAAHRRFADRAVPLTFLVDHPIATDAATLEILRRLMEDGRSAVGAQLHPWVNPPLDEAMVPANTFVGNLPSALEAAKLDVLTEAITKGIGVAPRIYRAGRYGIGPATLALLAERGYRIDSSMRSAYDYSAEAGPDFTAILNQAFRCGPDGQIVELPLTTVFTGAARSGGVGLYRPLQRIPKGRGVFARTGLLSRVALTPEDMPLADALQAIAVAVGEGLRLLNFAFHSPSLVPGHTPYVRDAADLAAFHHWWDVVLTDLDRRGVRPASLDDLIAASVG
uniref:polysaccharide deacetylase family protein n=1 Tax=Sphingomonas sp. TaxID=28214 RepID=UPI00344DD969